MGIPWISDRVRIQRVAKIRLGIKKQGQKGMYPEKSDHFIFTDCPEVAKVYGDNCKDLDVMFPTDDLNQVYHQGLEAWRGAAGLFCKCDEGAGEGGMATRVRVGVSDGKFNSPKVPAGQKMDPDGEAYIEENGLDVEVGAMFNIPCPGQDCPYFERKMCKPVGRLMFLLPKVGGIRCYEIDTTSGNSMAGVYSDLIALQSLAGRFRMIPLVLRLRPKEVHPDGKKSTVYVLSVHFEGTLEKAIACRKDQFAIAGPVLAVPRIEHRPAPDDLMPDAGQALEDTVGAAGTGRLKMPTPGAAREAARAALTTAPAEEESPPAGEEPTHAEIVDEPAPTAPAAQRKPAPTAPPPVVKTGKGPVKPAAPQPRKGGAEDMF